MNKFLRISFVVLDGFCVLKISDKEGHVQGMTGEQHNCLSNSLFQILFFVIFGVVAARLIIGIEEEESSVLHCLLQHSNHHEPSDCATYLLLCLQRSKS